MPGRLGQIKASDSFYPDRTHSLFGGREIVLGDSIECEFLELILSINLSWLSIFII